MTETDQNKPTTSGPPGGDDSLGPLTDHSYDGIQEYDNPTPSWWTNIFIVSMFWAALYMAFIWLTSGGLSPAATYERDYTASLKLQYGELGDVTPDAATLLRLSKDEKWLRVGAAIFQGKCVACHGADGSGITGPNLTDDSYINVKHIEDIADVVTNGRKNGAMPAWKNDLLPVEQVIVSAYVASLRGKNLPSVGGRPAEGDKIAPWETPK